MKSTQEEGFSLGSSNLHINDDEDEDSLALSKSIACVYVIGYEKRGHFAQIKKIALLVWGESAEFKLQNDPYLIFVACSYRELSTANDRPRRIVALEKNASKHWRLYSGNFRT